MAENDPKYVDHGNIYLLLLLSFNIIILLIISL
jgi:hypothetical protein